MKRIETAVSAVIELSDKRKVTIQEFTARQAVTTIGKFRKILALLKERDVLNLGNLRTEDDTLDLTKAIDWADVVLQIVEEQFDEVIAIILGSQITEDTPDGTVALIDADFDVLNVGDVVELVKAVYIVNVVEGSLKKTFGALVPTKAEATELPTPSKEPSMAATR